MLVDNLIQHPSYFTNSSFNDFSDIFNADLFANDSLNSSSNNSNSPATASSSRASSPQSPFQSTLLTPPQTVPPPSFPDYSPSSFFNFLEDEPSKQLDPMTMTMPSSAPYDFMSQFGGFGDMGMDSGMGMDINMDVSGLNTGSMTLVSEPIGIDPQLVGTPSALSDNGEEGEQDEDRSADADESASPSSSSASAASPPVVKSTTKSRSSKKTKEQEKQAEQEQEKLTLVIQPVKVGGHGKARKGTVQSGGVVKKTASATPVAVNNKENSSITSLPPPTYTHPSAFTPTNLYPPKSAGKLAGSEKDGDEDEDDLPQDWRPSPEVFQKMTSKEKRQLRNKISARNFRVRRKEYISTLEGDIAERDRLLDAIRSELGSTQSENYALRQEIAALKRTLLEGRGVSIGTPSMGDEFPLLNLPPPAPLPAQSAAASLALAQQQQQQQQRASLAPPSPLLTPANPTAQLLTANTQKDTSASGRFWGGVSANSMRLGMGGITPVHRVVLPEVSVTDLLGQFNATANVPKERKLQENINPMLNGTAGGMKQGGDVKTTLGFEGFADVNPFTMKTLDAYRMHLWGKMAQQHHAHQAQLHHQQQQQQQRQQHQHQQEKHGQTHLTGLASSLRPAFFAAPTSLSALLSGKHLPSSSFAAPPYSVPSSPPPPYQSAPGSPVLGFSLGKGSVIEKLERERERDRERERERVYAQKEKETQTAVYAALASQTLLRKLGSAFWDAFSGANSSSSASSGSTSSGGGSGGVGGGARAWDAEKVRRVLEGKAVVRVVDIEEPALARVPTPTASSSTTRERSQAPMQECAARKCCTEILEESMRSLTLGKKV